MRRVRVSILLAFLISIIVGTNLNASIECETYFESRPQQWSGGWLCGPGLSTCTECCYVPPAGEPYCCVSGHC